MFKVKFFVDLPGKPLIGPAQDDPYVPLTSRTYTAGGMTLPHFVRGFFPGPQSPRDITRFDLPESFWVYNGRGSIPVANVNNVRPYYVWANELAELAGQYPEAGSNLSDLTHFFKCLPPRSPVIPMVTAHVPPPNRPR